MGQPPIPEPCCDCVHFKGIKLVSYDDGWEGEEYAELYCNAFPDGIPEEIEEGRNRHRKPFPADRGIQYEKAP